MIVVAIVVTEIRAVVADKVPTLHSFLTNNGAVCEEYRNTNYSQNVL